MDEPIHESRGNMREVFVGVHYRLYFRHPNNGCEHSGEEEAAAETFTVSPRDLPNAVALFTKIPICNDCRVLFKKEAREIQDK